MGPLCVTSILVILIAMVVGTLSKLDPRSEALVAERGEEGPMRTSVPRVRQESTNKIRSNRTNVGLKKPSVRRITHPSLYAALDEYNRLCVLAKFQATFIIKYETTSGATQIIDKMPINAKSKGHCDQFDEEPTLDVMWKESQLVGGTYQRGNNTGGFTFRIIFQQFPEEDRWGVQQMQLLYHTGHPVFKNVANPRKYIVKSDKEDYRLQFHTNFATSLLCPSPPPIQMYDGNGTLRVIARLSNLQLQAFEFEDPKGSSNFDSFARCEQVSFGSGVAHHLSKRYTGSLTFGIGVMTVCIASLTVVGYAAYRSHIVNSDNYKNIG